MKLKNKRGNYGSVFMFLVMAFLIVVFFGLMYWGFGQMNTVLTNVHFRSEEHTSELQSH